MECNKYDCDGRMLITDIVKIPRSESKMEVFQVLYMCMECGNFNEILKDENGLTDNEKFFQIKRSENNINML
jgi:hypothetical protein